MVYVCGRVRASLVLLVVWFRRFYDLGWVSLPLSDLFCNSVRCRRHFGSSVDLVTTVYASAVNAAIGAIDAAVASGATAAASSVSSAGRYCKSQHWIGLLRVGCQRGSPWNAAIAIAAAVATSVSAARWHCKAVHWFGFSRVGCQRGASWCVAIAGTVARGATAAATTVPAARLCCGAGHWLGLSRVWRQRGLFWMFGCWPDRDASAALRLGCCFCRDQSKSCRCWSPRT